MFYCWTGDSVLLLEEDSVLPLDRLQCSTAGLETVSVLQLDRRQCSTAGLETVFHSWTGDSVLWI